MSAPVLQMEDLAVGYPGSPRPVLDGLSLELHRGETVALLGESGCGKTTLARAMVGLLPLARGRVRFEEHDLDSLAPGARRLARRRIQLVFQGTETALDPRRTVAESIAEGLVIHRVGTAAERQRRVGELLERVGLAVTVGSQRPDELSGGQRQRVGIARALALEPAVLIADEPTSALDVAVQVSILDLFADLKRSLGLGCLLISHDQTVVRYLSERVAVMHQGRIIETGPTRDVLEHPRLPATRVLLGVEAAP